MPAVMEHTITIDRLLAQRADRKLRQYSWSLDDAIIRSLIAIVTIPGEPEKPFVSPVRSSACRKPGSLRGRIRIADDFDAPSDEIAKLFENSSS